MKKIYWLACLILVLAWSLGPCAFFDVRVLGKRDSLISHIASIFMHWILFVAIVQLVSLFIKRIKK
jgi:hypothetical protein